MLAHVLCMGALIGLIVLCTLLPFLPGRHDSLAVPLSVLAQMVAVASLLLVPIGGTWLVSTHRDGGSAGSARSRDIGRGHAITATVVFSTVLVVVCLGAAISGELTLGLLGLVVSLSATWKVISRLRAANWQTTPASTAAPYYLMVVPVGAVLLQLALVAPGIDFSRERAIRNSVPLIADIERYRVTRGEYPRSLLSVWKDYEPGIVGVSQYHYESSGDAYNLFFEQLTRQVGTREFVVYNPLDEQVMTSHDADILQLTPGELAPRRGFYGVQPTSHPHWKLFWFD